MPEAEGDEDNGGVEQPVLRFRNYDPRAAELKELVAQPAPVADVSEDIKAVAEAAEQPVQTDVRNIVPKKPNWDLKRDVAPQLEILQKQTRKAIAKLARELAEKEDAEDAE